MIPGRPWPPGDKEALRQIASGEAKDVDDALRLARERIAPDLSRAQVQNQLHRMGIDAEDVRAAHYTKAPPVIANVYKTPPEAPAWQGYRPRATWEPPEKAKAAKAAKAPEVIRSVVTADWHKPYTDRKAWGCALGVIKDLRPHRNILDGDGMEMEALSKHPKSRPDLTRLSEEYHAMNVALDEWQGAAPDAEAIYVEGNHEGRGPRFFAEHGSLDGMLDVPGSLYITPRSDYHRETVKLRGVRWIPLKMQPFQIGAVGYLHGVFESLYHAAMTAQHLGPKCGIRHLVSAHMHGWQSFASPSGYTAYACPWLGDETAHTIRSYVKGKPRPWHLGLLYIEECGDDVNVTPIFIRNGRALVGGRLVAA